MTDVVIDKTGTLTEGRLALKRVHLLGRRSEAECLALAASLEASSRHPIRHAFSGSGAFALQDVRHAVGEGIEARHEGRLVRIGRREFCAALCALPLERDTSASVFLAERPS